MSTDDTYNTIASRSSGQFRDRGSRFIAIAFPINDEESIKSILTGLRKEYHDASHHCFAWVLGHDKSSFRMNDDGEPAGSAGRPIYGQILSKDLTNVLIVVIRYFGGTKLGIPGLINAYRTASAIALGNTTVIIKTIHNVYEIIYEYQVMNDVMKILKEEHAEQIETSIELTCHIVFSVRKNNAIKVFEKLSKINNLQIRFLHTR
jgi:uncharacterized YigZ family protein